MEMTMEDELAPIAKLENHLAALESLREQIELQGVDQGVVLEIDRIMGDSVALEGYYSTQNQSKRTQLALEAVSGGVIAIAIGVVAGLAALIVKMINWLTGSKKSGEFTADSKQVEAIQTIVKDQEVHEAMLLADNIAKSANGVATESEDGVVEVFDTFKRSLTEPEIDFLTSGHRYRIIREAVSDFTKGRYYEFVKGVEKDITDWIREGLDKAPHVAKGDEAVEAFVREQRSVYDLIIKNHAKTVEGIKEMGSKYLTHVPQGSSNHLQMFQNKPSSLYPHIERLWSEIHFGRMSEEDRKLLASLDQVQRRYEESSRRLKNVADVDGRPWPAVEAVVKLGINAHRTAVNDIGMLVRVAGFISHSAKSAYSATMKSFGYIIRILSIVSKRNGADRERIQRSLEIMQRKRKELNDILQFN